ncbi:MAG: KpsF/GutQ family sugar-phosphate isomerase [Alphaproteobacteria bacterium]
MSPATASLLVKDESIQRTMDKQRSLTAFGSQEGDVAAGQELLLEEAEALKLLAESLDVHFYRAVETISRARGRVVVTGMGKSGHVARKIAATMASTGTPAMFVHPGEASHGDLGMITREDVILGLSNSGETAELADILRFAKRFDIPLIGMTMKADSSLGQYADIPLLLPKLKEACPMGLAPTTSTTMMIALGDALAVALLKRKQFGAQDFGVFHPGGSLGKQLLKVAEIMHGAEDLPLVSEDTMMSDAIVEMSERRLGTVGVIDGDGGLIGVLTDGDLRRHLSPDLLAQPIGDIMTRDPRTISPNALLAEALGTMNSIGITSLFVLADGTAKPVGLIHIHDCLKAGLG